MFKCEFNTERSFEQSHEKKTRLYYFCEKRVFLVYYYTA